MRLNDVINRFSLLSGLEPSEVTIWTPVCIDSMLQIEVSATEEALKNEESILRLCSCAGALAYYKYCLYRAEDSVRSFTAGAVTVTHAPADIQKARTLWEHEKSSVADLLASSDDFCFRSVKL